jgi:hypothetical protein
MALFGGGLAAVPPNNPVRFSIKDWDQVCEKARDRFTLVVNGAVPAVVPRKIPAQHTLRRIRGACNVSRGLSVNKIAGWLGTSSSMMEKYYNR